MANNLLEKFEENGVDTQEGMHRFMNNEEMYIKFIIKFLDDDNIQVLHNAIADNDVDKAFAAAHTIKGVAGNLSMKKILEIIVPMVEILRGKSMDGVEQMYNEFVQRIDELKSVVNA